MCSAVNGSLRADGLLMLIVFYVGCGRHLGLGTGMRGVVRDGVVLVCFLFAWVLVWGCAPVV